MAVLVEGQEFALSSKSQTSKSVVYVKLTDSALRSLEEYLKQKVRIILMIMFPHMIYLLLDKKNLKI